MSKTPVGPGWSHQLNGGGGGKGWRAGSPFRTRRVGLSPKNRIEWKQIATMSRSRSVSFFAIKQTADAFASGFDVFSKQTCSTLEGVGGWECGRVGGGGLYGALTRGHPFNSSKVSLYVFIPSLIYVSEGSRRQSCMLQQVK